MVVRKLLSYKPAHRESEYVDAFQAERPRESNYVACRTCDGICDGSARSTDAGVVEENHVVGFCDEVNNRRIPVVHSSAKVLKKNDRSAALDAESAVRVAVALALDEEVRGSFMRVCGDLSSDHRASFIKCRSFTDLTTVTFANLLCDGVDQYVGIMNPRWKEWAARLATGGPFVNESSCEIAQRSDLNAARTSVVKSSGCSQAAKWPPLSTSLK